MQSLFVPLLFFLPSIQKQPGTIVENESALSVGIPVLPVIKILIQ